MTLEQDNHLESIQNEFNELVTYKYRKGVSEHGGNIWDKPGLLDEAINEAVDMVVYLLTLRQQRDNKKPVA